MIGSARYVLVLVGFNAIWAANAVWAKYVLESISPEQFSWARYSSAWLFYVFIWFSLSHLPRARSSAKKPFVDIELFIKSRKSRDWLIIAAMGFVTFFMSPLTQYWGLRLSTVTENTVIVAMEPIMSVVMAALFLRERISKKQLTVFALALSGFFMLSRFSPQSAASAFESSGFGNFLILLSLCGEVTFTIVGSQLVKRFAPSSVFASALTVGLVLLTIVTLVGPGLPDLSNLTGRSILGIIWVGPLSTAIGYVVWMEVLKHLPVSVMAPTLFVQPLVGSLLGWLLMGERLLLLQWIGAMLILAAVTLEMVPQRFMKKR